jgi:hypothetical protein
VVEFESEDILVLGLLMLTLISWSEDEGGVRECGVFDVTLAGGGEQET